MAISITQQSPALSIIERQAQERAQKSEQLASGKRINRAADDAAGLQISERLSAQINDNNQRYVNTLDNINSNNTQGAQLSAISESLQRANVLSIQSGGQTGDNNAIQAELDQLTEEINTLASSALGQDNFLSGVNANDPAATQTAIAAAFTSINDAATTLGASSNAQASQAATYQTTAINVSSARSRITDTDYASATSEQQKANTLLQTAVINKRDEESRKGLLINKLI